MKIYSYETWWKLILQTSRTFLNLFVCYLLMYAHIEIVVTFLVVKIFGLLVIARDHGSFEQRH